MGKIVKRKLVSCLNFVKKKAERSKLDEEAFIKSFPEEIKVGE